MNAIEIYRQKKNALLRAMDAPVFNKYFGPLGRDLRRSLNIMFRDLDALATNQQPQPTRDEARLVAITARTLSEVLMYQPLTPFMVNFSKDFAEVLKNWNDQLVRAQDIAHYASFIARVSEDYLTMHELAQILRGFVPRMQRMMEYTPPAFDLSRHYLEMVLKRHEAGQPINKYEEAIMSRKGDKQSDAVKKSSKHAKKFNKGSS